MLSSSWVFLNTEETKQTINFVKVVDIPITKYEDK